MIILIRGNLKPFNSARRLLSNSIYPQYENKAKSVLVAGANGGLGKHIVKMLISSGVKTIVCVDISPNKIKYKLKDENQRIITQECDITADGVLLGSLIKEHQIESIVSSVMPKLFTAPRPLYKKINVDAVSALVNLAKESSSVKSFVYISSIATTNHFVPSRKASEKDPLPAMEDYISPYDRTKRISENLVISTNGFDNGRLKTISLRPGGILADASSPTVKEALITNPIVRIGEGEPIDYCHGIDIAHAVGCALNKLHEPSGVSICAGKCYFVTGTPLKASDIVRLISKFRGNVPVKALPEALGTVISATTNLQRDILEFIGHETPAITLGDFIKMGNIEQTFDNSLALKELGWRPLVSIEEGIKSIVEDHKQQIAM